MFRDEAEIRAELDGARAEFLRRADAFVAGAVAGLEWVLGDGPVVPFTRLVASFDRRGVADALRAYQYAVPAASGLMQDRLAGAEQAIMWAVGQVDVAPVGEVVPA